MEIKFLYDNHIVLLWPSIALVFGQVNFGIHLYWLTGCVIVNFPRRVK
jgi:hypothetical protein